MCTAWEVIILLITCIILFFYGLIPVHLGSILISSNELGLVGADESRYAQVAREMLEAHSDGCHALQAQIRPESTHFRDIKVSAQCAVAGAITPILYGHPWLEKPALYYWSTTSFFKELGVFDWVARLPSGTSALAMVFVIYRHMRRFRPGAQLDAALITASTIAVVSFARGASTDMQLAAPFAIGMLGWYAWYETGKKFWLFDLYFFGALATLAKGPAAPFLALCILTLFAGLRGEWSILRRTIWLPGCMLYFGIVLPWYIAVQLRNPTFFRFFVLEQNLQRFSSNRYLHHQPIYFYLVVVILALMPWTVIALRALADSVQLSIAAWRIRHKPYLYLDHASAGDAFPEFLVLWAFFPILFFTFSGSKLPGYILPAIPPITILAADYLNRIRRAGLPNWVLIAHGVTVAIFVLVLLLCPHYMIYQKVVPPTRTLVVAALSAIVFALATVTVVRRWGLRTLRVLTVAPVLLLLFFLLHINGWLLDSNYSARPLAARIEKAAPGVPILVTNRIRRDTDYGLCFYHNQPLRHYVHDNSPTEKMAVIDGIPIQEHILVIRTADVPALPGLLPNRIYQPLFHDDWQGLTVYRVAASSNSMAD